MRPKPSHAAQAPRGELNEKSAGTGSANARPHALHASPRRNVGAAERASPDFRTRSEPSPASNDDESEERISGSDAASTWRPMRRGKGTGISFFSYAAAADAAADSWESFPRTSDVKGALRAPRSGRRPLTSGVRGISGSFSFSFSSSLEEISRTSPAAPTYR